MVIHCQLVKQFICELGGINVNLLSFNILNQ